VGDAFHSKSAKIKSSFDRSLDHGGGGAQKCIARPVTKDQSAYFTHLFRLLNPLPSRDRIISA
jgi:hypothetical protein